MTPAEPRLFIRLWRQGLSHDAMAARLVAGPIRGPAMKSTKQTNVSFARNGTIGGDHVSL
jgi:hypothetical protein